MSEPRGGGYSQAVAGAGEDSSGAQGNGNKV